MLHLGRDVGVVSLRGENGHAWKVENHALQNWMVHEVACDPAAPNRVFAGTRGDGVWLSEDFGQSWKKPCYGKPGPAKVRCITIDPHDPNTLYAGTEPIDLFVSHDLGKNWKNLDSLRKFPHVESVGYPVPTVEPHLRDIVVDPNDPKKIYIALQVGYILKSTDGGGSWELLDKDLDADVHTIVIDPVNTDNIFIATGGHGCRIGQTKGRALYVSHDAGKSWQPIATEFPQEFSAPLAMHPKDPKVLLSAVANGPPPRWRRPSGAESKFIRTSDGGKTWERLERGLSDASESFATDIIFDDTDPHHITIVLTNGELYSSGDSGDSWARLDVKVPPISPMRSA